MVMMLSKAGQGLWRMLVWLAILMSKTSLHQEAVAAASLVVGVVKDTLMSCGEEMQLITSLELSVDLSTARFNGLRLVHGTFSMLNKVCNS
jgi:hypothetical protein